jgi:hypothetical protein
MKQRGIGVPGGNEIRWKEHAGLLVPETMPEAIGFGCPKCDDHELVPSSRSQEETVAIIADFRNRHRGHGVLHTLEKRGGKVIATSEVPGLT